MNYLKIKSALPRTKVKTKINCFYISHCSEIIKKIIVVSKVKTKLIHIPNYKLNRIIDRTQRPLNVFLRSDNTFSTSLKIPEIPVFQHLIIKNDIVFQFFQQKLKKMALFLADPINPANPAIITMLPVEGTCVM